MKFFIPPMRELGNLSESSSHKLFFFGTMEKIISSPLVPLIYVIRCYILQNRKSFLQIIIKKGKEKTMKKMEQLYEGKAKKVFATDDPDVVIVDYKDDAVKRKAPLWEKV